VSFTSANTGNAVGWCIYADPRIRLQIPITAGTNDGGNSWLVRAAIGLPPPRFFVRGVLRAVSNGIAVGDYMLINPTRYGTLGVSLGEQPFPTYLNGVYVDRNAVTVVGYDGYSRSGLILRNGTRQSSGTSPPLYGVSCVDANTCWAVGEGGTILHTTTGGE
jgi:hypothetical protein